MLLAVDIGNTNTHCGIFEGSTLRRAFRIPTHGKGYWKDLKPYLKKAGRIIIVSVAPDALKKMERFIKSSTDCRVMVVGRDLDSGVKNLYARPRQVGQDRLVNARAAFEIYGGQAIVVDFGTAITIDVINRKKEYLGGVIAPGVEISVSALSECAALLPEIKIKRPAGILGRETRESMLSGAVYGFSGMCDSVVEKLKKRYCKNCKVVATGGMSPLIAPYCGTVDRIDPDLTLKGLRLIGADRNV